MKNTAKLARNEPENGHFLTWEAYVCLTSGQTFGAVSEFNSTCRAHANTLLDPILGSIWSVDGPQRRSWSLGGLKFWAFLTSDFQCLRRAFKACSTFAIPTRASRTLSSMASLELHAFTTDNPILTVNETYEKLTGLNAATARL